MKSSVHFLLQSLVAFGTVCVFPSGGIAQLKESTPDADVTINVFNYDYSFFIGTGGGFTATHVWFRPLEDPAYTIWEAPPPGTIIDVRQKDGLPEQPLVVLLADGSVFILTQVSSGDWRATRRVAPNPNGSESFKKVKGDALYMLSSSSVRISRDTATTWQLDTTGLGNETITDIDLDSSQYIFGVTPHTLFRQHPDSSIWRRSTTFPTQSGSSLASVFVDRLNRIFVGTGSQGVYRSTDNGATWAQFSTGMGNIQIKQFADDPFGNVYAVPGGNQVYRSSGGTLAWTQIAGSLMTLTGTSLVINGVVADSSSVIAATNFGTFRTTNQGATWTDESQGMQAETITGLLKRPSGRLVVGAPRGIYYKNAIDTIWTRTYPVGRYLGGLRLWADELGSMYTVDYSSPSIPAAGDGYPFKSTDIGTTWTIDTAGISGLPSKQVDATVFSVDETGAQHTRDRLAPGASFFFMYKRALGGSWTIDTTGMNVAVSGFDSPNSFTSDGAGNFFCAYSNNRMYRRAIAGGVWSLDTAGLGLTQLTFLSQGAGGDVYGGSIFLNGPLYRRRAGVWTHLTLPATVTSSGIGAVSVDGSGALFVAFFHRLPNYGNGVYFTTNSGTSWTKVGLDSITVTQLISSGDTTYALTSGRGVYKLTRAPLVDVTQSHVYPSSYALYQCYPNPFNPVTTISYQIPSRGLVNLGVFDILGREIATLVNRAEQSGRHNVTWDASRYSSGVYFYRLIAGDFTETKKLLLMK